MSYECDKGTICVACAEAVNMICSKRVYHRQKRRRFSDVNKHSIE